MDHYRDYVLSTRFDRKLHIVMGVERGTHGTFNFTSNGAMNQYKAAFPFKSS